MLSRLSLFSGVCIVILMSLLKHDKLGHSPGQDSQTTKTKCSIFRRKSYHGWENIFRKSDVHSFFYKKLFYKTNSQIKWDMRLQNVKKIQINIFWALLYHIDKETSFQDTKLTPNFFLELNDFFSCQKNAHFWSKSDICS